MAPSDEQVTIECQTNAKSTHFECLAMSTVSRHSQVATVLSSKQDVIDYLLKVICYV